MSSVIIAGDTSGTVTLAAPAVAGTTTLTLPATTDTLVGKTTTDTLTNKTLTNPTFNSAQLATVSGTAPLYMCRAWVYFNGTGTIAINGSGNVSSITDNGTGDYQVVFTTAIVDANYSVGISTDYDGVSLSIGAKNYATTAFKIQSILPNFSNYTDKAVISCQVFR
jgi:hypothetical protein